MGGALAVPGNVTPCAEANVANDPAAADAVLRGGLRTRMIGLDVTHQAILTREDTAAWRELGTPAGRLFADMTDHYIAIYEENNPQMGGCALHDPLALPQRSTPRSWGVCTPICASTSRVPRVVEPSVTPIACAIPIRPAMSHLRWTHHASWVSSVLAWAAHCPKGGLFLYR